MPDKLNKYFWDSPIDTFSPKYQIIRLLEYASFADLFVYPFENFKSNLAAIDFDLYRIPDARKKLFERLVPFVASSISLEDAIRKYVDSIFGERSS